MGIIRVWKESRRKAFSIHICKALDCLCEVLDCLLCIPMFDAVPDTVLYMTFENNLAAAMKGRLCSVDLGEQIFAGNVLVHHTVNCLYLSNNLFQSPVKILAVHAFFHSTSVSLSVC